MIHLSDFEEVNYDGNAYAYTPGSDLNPLSADTDGDGVDDATEMLYGTNPLDSSDYVIPGDVNFDRLVDLPDYMLLLRFVLGMEQPSIPAANAGDMNRNSQMDAGDLVILLHQILE